MPNRTMTLLTSNAGSGQEVLTNVSPTPYHPQMVGLKAPKPETRRKAGVPQNSYLLSELPPIREYEATQANGFNMKGLGF